MRVEKLLKRLRREFIKVNLIQASLDSIIAFLSADLVLFLMNVTLINEQVHYQALAALTFVFFLGDWVHRSRKYRLEIYEQENPQLQEILRTARDNLDNQNIVSQAMFDDLMERARSVTSESIVPSTEIIKKILVIGLLSFLTVLSGLVNFQPVQESREVFSQFEPQDILNPGGRGEGVLKNASAIYGEQKSIDAISTELKIKVTGNATGGEQGNVRALNREDFTFEAANPEMPDDVELARKYSLAIRE
ncbi:MAG: hypothetical protein ABEK16_02580 [Candidatus Nanohalobium sp.]